MSKEFFNNSIYTKELITRSENITFTKESSLNVMKRAAKLVIILFHKIILFVKF